MTYNCNVVKITNLSPHPNADNLMVFNYNGETYITSKDVQVGDTMLLFREGGVLSPDFLKNNSLYRHAEFNKDTGKVGYFEEGGRVRAVKLRGIESFGVLMPLSSLSYLNFEGELPEEFDTLRGIKVCWKYETPATLRDRRARGEQGNRKWDVDYGGLLKRHYDTEQLASLLKVLPNPFTGSVYVTEKIHGTSGRTGRFYIKHEGGTLWERIKRWATGNKPVLEYISGSRNMIINTFRGIADPAHKEHYRWRIHEFIAGLNLHPGETLYYEIVGYTHDSTPIMSRHNSSKLKNPDFTNKFGLDVTYSYGNPAGVCSFYVYRITQQLAEGATLELTTAQVQTRCVELGLNYVPFIGVTFLPNTEVTAEKLDKVFGEINDPMLESKLTLGRIQPTPVEGYVFKFEDAITGRIYAGKKKTWNFMMMEGLIRDNPEYVDTEEVS